MYLNKCATVLTRSCHWTVTHTHTQTRHFCSSVSDCFTLLYKNATNHVPFLLYFSILMNSRLYYLLLLKSCVVTHVGYLLWQKSVVRLHNNEWKPMFCRCFLLKRIAKQIESPAKTCISASGPYKLATVTASVQDTCVSDDVTLLKLITSP
jgi:hypothetical protein